MTSDPGAFDRGVAAGEISQRLKEHDRRFDLINGTIAENTRELAGLTLAIQRLDDRMKANLETVATTADAVEKERDATATAVEKVRTTARDVSERRWSPLARAIAVILALVAVTSLVLAVYSATHK